MDETLLIETVQDHFDSLLNVAVVTKQVEDARPIPAVILADWSTEDISHHNTAKTGETRAHGDVGYSQRLTFHWETRLEFTVVDYDEVDANMLQDRVVDEWRILSEQPEQLHPHIRECRKLPSGNPQQTFTEPNETELTVSALVAGAHTVVLTADEAAGSVIEQVQDSFTINE